jgi:hypothetical protein
VSARALGDQAPDPKASDSPSIGAHDTTVADPTVSVAHDVKQADPSLQASQVRCLCNDTLMKGSHPCTAGTEVQYQAQHVSKRPFSAAFVRQSFLIMQ